MPQLTRSAQQPVKSIRSHYHLLGRVGQGQYSQVFCAIHKATGDVVALKQIDPTRSLTAQSLRELRLLVTLQHPNVVAWQGYNHCREGRYLVMDYCEGGTLRQLMPPPLPQALPLTAGSPSATRRERSERIGSAVAIVADVLRGLVHVHGHGMIHADVKPENILLRLAPGGWQARLADFGIACLSCETAPLDSFCGSPAYMAPERFGGAIGPTADLYAIGIILYELLVGDRPFAGTPGELQTAHLTGAIVLPESLPQGLQQVLHQALQKAPGDRFASAAAMLAALQPFLPTPLPESVMLMPTQSIWLDRRHQLHLTQSPQIPHTTWRLHDRADNCLAQFQTMTQFQSVQPSAQPYTLQAIELGGRELTIELQPLRVTERH
jgi:serine/threonine protein kinase